MTSSPVVAATRSPVARPPSTARASSTAARLASSADTRRTISSASAWSPAPARMPRGEVLAAPSTPASAAAARTTSTISRGMPPVDSARADAQRSPGSRPSIDAASRRTSAGDSGGIGIRATSRSRAPPWSGSASPATKMIAHAPAAPAPASSASAWARARGSATSPASAIANGPAPARRASRATAPSTHCASAASPCVPAAASGIAAPAPSSPRIARSTRSTSPRYRATGRARPVAAAS